MSHNSTITRAGRCLLALLVVVSLTAPALASVAGAAAETSAATVAIHQPDYVDDDVRTTTSNGNTIYVASGEELLVTPTNIDTADVVETGVEESEGQLRYDGQFDHYVFTPGVNGTYTLFWVVEEEQTVGNESDATTETVQQRYAATIKVERTAYEHAAPGTIDQYREDAANWREWEDQLTSEFGESIDVETRTQVAFNLLRIRYNPIETITGGQILAILIMLVSIGGATLMALDRLRELATTWPLVKELNKRKSLDSDRSDLDETLDEYDAVERERKIVKMNPADIFDDDQTAFGMQEAWGETVRDMWVNFNSDSKMRSVLHDRLQAFALADYAAAVSWDDHAAELTARIVPPDGTVGEDEYRVPLHQQVRDDGDRVDTVDHVTPIMEILDVNDDTLFADRLCELDIDRQELQTRTDSPATVDELADELHEERDYFADDEAYVQALVEMVEDVYYSPYTDEDGSEDPIRATLSTFYRQAAILGDRYQLPLAQVQKDRLELALDMYDPVTEARSTLQHSQEGRYAHN